MWIARLRTTDGENEIIAEKRLLQKDATTSFQIAAWLFRHSIDDYNLDAIEELDGCYDCMDTVRDIQYVLSVFEQGNPDPYDIMKRELERLIEKRQRRKEEADAKKDSGASCTCELIF